MHSFLGLTMVGQFGEEKRGQFTRNIQLNSKQGIIHL